MKCVFATLLFLVMTNLAFGQKFSPEEIARRLLPNPENDLAIATLVSNPSVAKEVQLPANALNDVLARVKESGGSLSSPTQSYTWSKDSGKPNERPPAADVYESLLAVRAKNEEVVHRVLNEAQLDRLRQIAYQIEVTKLGLAESLLEGRLGKKIGLEDYQRPALETQAFKIDAAANEATVKVRQEALNELLKELSEEQKLEAQKLVGRLFVFRKELDQRFQQPNPEAILEIVELLRHDSIAREIGLSNGDHEKIVNLMKMSNGRLSAPNIYPFEKDKKLTKDQLNQKREAHFQKSTEAIESILDPGQRDRLKELAYQTELAKHGIAHGLTEGYLGKKLALTDEQKEKIRLQSERIEAKTNGSLVQIQEAAQAELLSELIPRQRVIAKKLLGKPFIYRE